MGWGIEGTGVRREIKIGHGKSEEEICGGKQEVAGTRPRTTSKHIGTERSQR